MVGWHHQFNGHELGQTLRHGERQGGLCLWHAAVRGVAKSGTRQTLNMLETDFMHLVASGWKQGGALSLSGSPDRGCEERPGLLRKRRGPSLHLIAVSQGGLHDRRGWGAVRH